MRTSESIAKIAPALLAAQKAIGAVVKSAENPYFKSKYADLAAVIDAVKPGLNAAGIAFLQAVMLEDGAPVLETILLHESGEFMATVTPIYCKNDRDPQAFGSGVTYSKRYALQALCGLPTEDDDANAAAAEPKEGKPKAIANKPDVDLNKLRSEAGVAYLRKTYPSAKDALAALGKTKTITNEVHAFITELYEAQPVKA